MPFPLERSNRNLSIPMTNATTEDSSSPSGVVRIPYHDLVTAVSCRSTGDGATTTNDTAAIHQLIEEAFSSSGLGIVAITDVPNLSRLRLELLPLAQNLATLSSEQLEEITVPESDYQVGWSHGREKLEGDKFDYGKGSFYANPLTEDLTETMLERRNFQRSRIMPCNNVVDYIDDGVENEVLEWDESLKVVTNDDELRSLADANPAFFAPNIWPSKQLPVLESSFKEAGRMVREVGIMVAKCCDSYVSAQCPGYEPKLENILRHSKCCKARLLHYFPMDDEVSDNDVSTVDDSQFSNWCGWHNDHGSLTGLLPAMYLDGNGNIVNCPDEKAGLYIKARSGELVHAKIPENAIAFQVGETAQIHTGGWLQATPHAVRGCKGVRNISRETFAVFMEPEYHTPMNLPVGRTLEDTQCIEAEKYLPSNTRTLRSRWKLGMNFGEFSNATFAAFH